MQEYDLKIDISSYLQGTRQLIEERLEKLLPKQNSLVDNLFEAARYAVLGAGKRLRPVLTLTTAQTFGVSPELALNAACALEMVHAYSLIHDDLPCMDDDDFRRGKPSLHKAYSEGHAVLTGDYLLTYAFEVLAQDPFLPTETKLSLIALLARKAGALGMIGGQVMDIEAEGLSISLDQLTIIHQHKTGALISASIEFGGLIAGASREQMSALRSFGEAIGLAFQIIDDVIDVESSEEKHGKATSSDAINQKSTYVTLLGLSGARKHAETLLAKAQGHLRELPGDTTLLYQLSNCLVDRSS